MAAKWLNSVDVDFGVQFPRLNMRKEVNVVIRDSNIQEKFVRTAGIPPNLDLGVVKTRLKEFGTIIDARWECYRVAEDDVLYPVLVTWMIVRMTLTKNIPSYFTIGSYRAMVKYEGQKPTCRLCDDETHFSYNCPTLRRNKEPTNFQKPGNKMTKKTETVPEKPVTLPLDVDPMVSKALLGCGIQNDLSRQTPPAQMIIPETQPVASEPMTISMEPVEPNLGEVEPMETNKSKFWGVIAPHFLDMFNHILERETLMSSQSRVAFRLIPKYSGLCGISNFRPIYLLNCDSKVMVSVLARRLRDVIQFVDDRGCHDSSNFAIQGISAAIVGVDFKKAYDLVNREVLWRILDIMGYPTTFVRWLQTKYSVTGMSILNGSEVAAQIRIVVP
ncbi:Uncharacterized protein APZ42_032925 [Daphnia magna]|uniref:Uncharacterized protein n=1 Tax=Daphnia magna TaxID=35525 RepID=A0A162D8F0_9CRUS|nr:Uncharacterized protein APZ42_032925 [Daphnia magna]